LSRSRSISYRAREALSTTAAGELTIHGVTRTVQIPVDAERNGSVVTVVGSIEIVFSDYGMTSPQSMAVLSVDDSGIMEFQLHSRVVDRRDTTAG
jgi:polyisoprenoid-binding protein YceI